MASIPPFRCDSPELDEGTREDGSTDTWAFFRTDNAGLLRSVGRGVPAECNLAFGKNNVPKCSQFEKESSLSR